MFAVRGFTSVSLDDIGAAVGIAGASIYNHFGSKLELLETAFDRGTEPCTSTCPVPTSSRRKMRSCVSLLAPTSSSSSITPT
jgi:AcrR family transcriptional regulator